MPTQTESIQRSQAIEAFAATARKAKLAEESSTNRQHEAAEALMVAGCELLALEGNHRNGNELSPHLKIHLDRESSHLAGHIDLGPARADKRRAVLARALPLVSEQRQGSSTASQLATKLNTPSRGRPLQLLTSDESRPIEKQFSGTLKREFNGADARNLVAALSDLKTSLNVHLRRMESVFDREYAHRDVPQASPSARGKRARSFESDSSPPPQSRARMASSELNIYEYPDTLPARTTDRNDERSSSNQRPGDFLTYERRASFKSGSVATIAHRWRGRCGPR